MEKWIIFYAVTVNIIETNLHVVRFKVDSLYKTVWKLFDLYSMLSRRNFLEVGRATKDDT